MRKELQEEIEKHKKNLRESDPGMGTAEKHAGLLQGSTDVALTEAVEKFQEEIQLSTTNLVGVLDLTQQQLTKSVKALNEQLASSTDKIIESETKLARSTDKHSRVMIWLTTIMAITAIIQAVAAFFQTEISMLNAQIAAQSLETQMMDLDLIVAKAKSELGITEPVGSGTAIDQVMDVSTE